MRTKARAVSFISCMIISEEFPADFGAGKLHDRLTKAVASEIDGLKSVGPASSGWLWHVRC